MRIRNFSWVVILSGAAAAVAGCSQPAEPVPVVVRKPIIEPSPAEPRVDIGGPRGGVHVDVPRANGPDIRVDVPPLRNPPPNTP